MVIDYNSWICQDFVHGVDAAWVSELWFGLFLVQTASCPYNFPPQVAPLLLSMKFPPFQNLLWVRKCSILPTWDWEAGYGPSSTCSLVVMHGDISPTCKIIDIETTFTVFTNSSCNLSLQLSNKLSVAIPYIISTIDKPHLNSLAVVLTGALWGILLI